MPPPKPTLEYRPLRRDEADEACALCRRVFDHAVAPGQSAEGNAMFHGFARPKELLARHRTRYTTWVAVDGPRLVGVLHVHATNHISLLFVEPEYQGFGCATALLGAAAAAGDFVAPATVNSSPNSVSYYARLGFVPDGPEAVRHGVRHRPMRLGVLPGALRRGRLSADR